MSPRASIGSQIAGVGHADPRLVVDNAELEAELGLEAGWIERRTGIRRRRLCAPDELTSELATAAARDALQRASMTSDQLGLIILATSTPDELLPPTGPVVAEALGCAAGAIDLAGACTGFVYALALGESFCARHRVPVLVVAANLLSRRVHPRDAGARVVFADGAGALVLRPAEETSMLGLHLGSEGAKADLIRIPAGGARQPLTAEALGRGEHLLRLDRGPKVFVEAVEGMVQAGIAATDSSGRSLSDLQHWVPHQANARIVERSGERLGLERDRWVTILADRGNSSAATIPTALSLADAEGRLQRGDELLLTAVGAGLLQAGAVVRWGTT